MLGLTQVNALVADVLILVQGVPAHTSSTAVQVVSTRDTPYAGSSAAVQALSTASMK